MNDPQTPPPSLYAREAGPDDLPDLARLNDAFNGENTSPAELALRLADPRRVEQALVAVLDGRVVGFAGLRIVPGLFYPVPYGELTELYVQPDSRRRGAARALLALAEQLAAARGVRELFVLTGRRNRAARAFYRAAGFAGDEVALSKDLPAGS